MRKNLIVATGINGEIGKDNELLWTKQKADMKLFKDMTSGTTVVMGRNTWESIPEKYRPLPNRVNIVVSRTLKDVEGAIVVDSIEEAINRAEGVNTQELWFMGGKSIYEEAFKLCDRLSITRIYESFPDADVVLGCAVDPEASGYKLTNVEAYEADNDNHHDYSFEIWERA